MIAEQLAEDRRLALLRILGRAPGYQGNAAVLHAAIMRYGHQASLELVRAELAWLAEQGLARIEELEAGILVATITERGLDVAGGRAVAPGVRRAPPGTCMA